MCRNILLFYISLFCCAVVTAQNSVEDYYSIRKEYAHRKENDAHALPSIKKSIMHAKKYRNLKHLFYAYEDAVLYAPEREDKLKYADSCLTTAKLANDEVLVSTALLGKGIIYYFNYRRFDKALDQYLLAAQIVEKTDDQYLKYKIKYNIGVVKSYLGFYNDALLYFRECLQFFENNLKSELLPPLRFNNTRGYLNTLHQMMICARQLNNWDEVERLLEQTNRYGNISDFSQEKAYFIKEKGIAVLNKGNWLQAVDLLLEAEQLLLHKKEEGHLSVGYFYLANAYLKDDNTTKALICLRKVDSLFSRNEAVIPEVPKTYGLLLKNRKFALTPEDISHFTGQLMKADSILQNETPNLSSRIYSEYDTKSLVVEKEKLMQAKNFRNTIITIAFVLIVGLVFFLYKSNQKRKKNLQSYKHLLQKYETATAGPLPVSKGFTKKAEYSEEVIEKLLKKLEEFERTNGFTAKDLTLESLARKLHTNKTHLSYVINEHKQMTLTNYLKTLRINYITNLMLSDPIYLNYNIGALGEMAGFKSRQQFSKQFFEVHNLRPVDFIMLRTKKE